LLPQQAPTQSQPRKAASPQQESDGSYVTPATSAFDPTGPNMVPCQIGDAIKVLERHPSGWTYCQNLSLPANSSNHTGWAPSWIVQPSADDSSNASRKPASRPKEHEASPILSSPSVAPQVTATAAMPTTGKAQESPVSVAQQVSSKVELHRSTQPAVAAAPTPQHAMQAAPPAPKAPSTVVRVATAAFSGSSSSQLTVNTGDLVEIVESHASGWTYGRKVHAPQHAHAGAIEGWFPDWVCAQK
jgi:hypothetical protein